MISTPRTPTMSEHRTAPGVTRNRAPRGDIATGPKFSRKPMQRGAADQQHAVSEQHQRSDPMVRQGVGEEIGCTDSEEQGS
jgi:hypothetical protein